jgi:hypothetical protein
VDEAFFQDAYRADAENAKRQSWQEYRRWVVAFYEGRRLPPVAGWNARADALRRHLREDVRAPILAELDAIGRDIAAEWAKSNEVRRISSDDLRALGGSLESAARGEDGSGARLREELARIRKDLGSRLARR